ncbi:MAG TPA: methyltransferase domain-containing protein [Dehalococcoidia bacterium]|nr:methyltransferase domain-containing protein [Dehalococcoidia bacterium]
MDAAKVKEIHRDRWSRSAREYQDVVVPIFAPVVEEVLRRAALRPGWSVLDVGTGPGVAALRAAEIVGPAGEIVGIDLAPDMITTAESRVRDVSGAGPRFAVMDAESLSFPDASFDAVIASLSLMLCPNPDLALREARRVLKPGGRIAAAVWGAVDRTAMGRLRILAEEYVAAPPGMTDANTLGDPALVDRLFRKAGFVVTVETIPIELTYRDAEHFWEAHSGSIKARLQLDQVEAIHRQILAELGPASPLRPRNELILASGTRA